MLLEKISKCVFDIIIIFKTVSHIIAQPTLGVNVNRSGNFNINFDFFLLGDPKKIFSYINTC
jgi:hypothetical protein